MKHISELIAAMSENWQEKAGVAISGSEIVERLDAPTIKTHNGGKRGKGVGGSGINGGLRAKQVAAREASDRARQTP